VATYVCGVCGVKAGSWSERCNACGAMALHLHGGYGSALASFLPAPAPAPPPPAVPVPPNPMTTSVPVPSTEVVEQHLPRDPTGLAPLDLVLGGGLVAGSVVVLGGVPGGSKSTLLAQALCGLGLRALYATGEETIAQVADRQRRIGAMSPRVLLVRETQLEVVLQHAEQLRVAVLAIDSIQTLRCGDVEQEASSAAQVRACAGRLVQFAKATNVAVIAVGHVSKDSTLAGPRTLEHLVDVVMMLSPSRGDVRLLTCPSKNRFGRTRVEGRFVLSLDPATPGRLEEAPAGEVEAPAAPENCPHCGLPLDGEVFS
jgi:DNA repair protein RadA/Sms